MLVFAHRGLSADHPENTVPAIRAAVEAGFAGIEVDLRCTQDGVVVVLHDARLNRTTSMNGRLSESSFAELPPEVPSLAELLETLQELEFQGTLDLELKEAEAAARSLELAKSQQWGFQILFSSVDPGALLHIPPDAGFERGLIPLGPPDEEDMEEAVDLHCSWIMMDQSYVEGDQIDAAKALGLKVGVWTVNDPAHLERLQNVDAIFTDGTQVLSAINATTI